MKYNNVLSFYVGSKNQHPFKVCFNILSLTINFLIHDCDFNLLLLLNNGGLNNVHLYDL